MIQSKFSPRMSLVKLTESLKQIIDKNYDVINVRSIYHQFTSDRVKCRVGQLHLSHFTQNPEHLRELQQRKFSSEKRKLQEDWHILPSETKLVYYRRYIIERTFHHLHRQLWVSNFIHKYRQNLDEHETLNTAVANSNGDMKDLASDFHKIFLSDFEDWIDMQAKIRIQFRKRYHNQLQIDVNDSDELQYDTYMYNIAATQSLPEVLFYRENADELNAKHSPIKMPAVKAEFDKLDRSTQERFEAMAKELKQISIKHRHKYITTRVRYIVFLKRFNYYQHVRFGKPYGRSAVIKDPFAGISYARTFDQDDLEDDLKRNEVYKDFEKQIVDYTKTLPKHYSDDDCYLTTYKIKKLAQTN